MSAETITETGIYHGDCRNLLRCLEPCSVDALISDMPYDVAKPNNFHTMGRSSIDFEWDKEPLSFDQWLPAVDKALKPSGNVILLYDIWKLESLKAFLEQDLGYVVKRPVCIWKTNPWPRNKERSAIQAVETGLWAVKRPSRGSKWTFNRRPEEAYETLVFEDHDDGSSESAPLVFKTGCARMAKGQPRHEALKPLSVIRDLVRIFSNEGDLVLDPFVGQGTTSVACELSGRRHISFEKRRDWYDAAVDRWHRCRDRA